MVLLVFDLDGTLTDTMGDDDRLFVDALRDAGGVTGPIPPWDEFPEVTDPAIVRELTGRGLGSRSRDMTMWHVRAMFATMWKRGLETGHLQVEPVTGAREILAECRSKPGFAAAIATGGWGPTAHMKLQAAGFATDDLVVVTADEAEERAAIIRTASILTASSRGIPGFSAMVVVGDGVWDAKAARDAGAGFVAIANDPEAALRLRTAGADAVLPSFEPASQFWSAVETSLRRLRGTPHN